MMLSVDTKVDVQYINKCISMKKIPIEVYTRDLREETIKMIIKDKMKVPDVARILSIP